jgi:hypothetical protein
MNSGLVSSCCASRSGERGTEERVLVEGRRPGFDEAAAFDEAAVEAEPNGAQRAGGMGVSPIATGASPAERRG